MSIDISIIIVNYNTKNLTYNCIQSIINNTSVISYEIILVDNASSDGSCEYLNQSFPEVIIVANKKNEGFGKANNIGAKMARGKYLFLLNSDTILIDNVCLSFFKKMEKEASIGACGGNLIYSNGIKNITYGNFPSLLQNVFDLGLKKIFPKYYLTHLSAGCITQSKKAVKVDYICGADIFIRKEIFNELNGFDENFFLYFEETDLFKRLFERNIISMIFPEIQIIHLSGQSNTKKQLSSNLFLESKYKYFKKHSNKITILLLIIIDHIEALKRITLKQDYTQYKTLKTKPWENKN